MQGSRHYTKENSSSVTSAQVLQEVIDWTTVKGCLAALYGRKNSDTSELSRARDPSRAPAIFRNTTHDKRTNRMMYKHDDGVHYARDNFTWIAPVTSVPAGAMPAVTVESIQPSNPMEIKKRHFSTPPSKADATTSGYMGGGDRRGE